MENDIFAAKILVTKEHAADGFFSWKKKSNEEYLVYFTESGKDRSRSRAANKNVLIDLLFDDL